jgi:hypothetical protein
MKGTTMKINALCLPASFILCVSLILIGCSTTAWMTKEIPDASSVTKGDHVIVLTKDRHTLTGEYINFQEIPMAEYVDLYQESTSNSTLGKILPRYGEYIILSTSAAPDKYWEGQFVSFDANNISVKFKGESKAEDIFISGLNSLANSRGASLQRMQFRQLFQSGDILLRSALILDNGGIKLKIPINTIDKITAQPDVKMHIAMDAEKNGYPSFLSFTN